MSPFPRSERSNPLAPKGRGAAFNSTWLLAHEQPGRAPGTNWWHCGHCNAYLDRWRGEGDQACRCGAQYNSSGQRLRDDWQENPAWRYDDIDDLEGFELQQLAREHRA